MHLDIDTERKKDDKDRPTHRLRQPRADSIPSVRPSIQRPAAYPPPHPSWAAVRGVRPSEFVAFVATAHQRLEGLTQDTLSGRPRPQNQAGQQR